LGTIVRSLIRRRREGAAPRVILGAIAAAGVVLTAPPASAQNLDAGKSPEKLFADGCASCHRSPRGLAKGRYSLTLSWFLQDHYSAGPDTAKALAAYLVSVDTPPSAPAKSGAKSTRSKPHPPKPVQGQ
jgi:mono/diheme cytochrome c family protein